MYCFSSSKWASVVPLHKNKNLYKGMYIRWLQRFLSYFFHPTENENEVFQIIRLFSSTYSDKKEKATNGENRLSRCV